MGSNIFHKMQTSCRKGKTFELLLEELSRPELEIPMISQHTSMVISKMIQNNTMMLPQLIRRIQESNEPLVLEITKSNGNTKSPNRVKTQSLKRSFPQGSEITKKKVKSTVGKRNYDNNGQSKPETPLQTMATKEEELLSAKEEVIPVTDEKQYEIIFSNSNRPVESDWDSHIIHSTTERTPASQHSEPGTVEVPNSFPLFQLVHTGVLSEDMQQEIVQLIRQANPQLDLNSITFKFKNPQTVEIIANVNL